MPSRTNPQDDADANAIPAGGASSSSSPLSELQSSEIEWIGTIETVGTGQEGTDTVWVGRDEPMYYHRLWTSDTIPQPEELPEGKWGQPPGRMLAAQWRCMDCRFKNRMTNDNCQNRNLVCPGLQAQGMILNRYWENSEACEDNWDYKRVHDVLKLVGRHDGSCQFCLLPNGHGGVDQISGSPY